MGSLVTGDADGSFDGSKVMGDRVGAELGRFDGDAEGDRVGDELGRFDGGCVIGCVAACTMGDGVGAPVSGQSGIISPFHMYLR